MGLRDDLKNQLQAAEQKRENDLLQVRQREAEEREERRGAAIEALKHLLSEETVKKIISAHIDDVGGLRVATLVLKNGPVAMIKNDRELPFDITFAADPMTANDCFHEATIRESVKALGREGVKVDHQFILQQNALKIQFDYRSL